MIKKALIAGFANLVLGLVLNMGIGLIIPGVTQEYQNTAIFRPWNDPLMMLYFAYPFILGFVLIHLWNSVKENAKKSPFEFAKLYFVIATIPGMFITFSSFQLSLTMILLWTITGFLQAFVAGYIFSKVK